MGSSMVCDMNALQDVKEQDSAAMDEDTAAITASNQVCGDGPSYPLICLWS